MTSASLRNLVIKDILYKIQHSEFQEDEIITEAQICERLNVSRTPVREALIELIANGMLQKVPRKGYAICKVDQKYKMDSFDILGALDALAATLAVPQITETDITKMYETVDLIYVAIKYKNYANYCDLQEQFHSIYIEKTNNPQLIKLLNELKSSNSRYTYFSPDTEKLFHTCSSVNDEHKYIVKLFEEKDTAQLGSFIKDIHWKTKFQDMI